MPKGRMTYFQKSRALHLKAPCNQLPRPDIWVSELLSEVFSFEKLKKYLVFRSIYTIFAPENLAAGYRQLPDWAMV